MGRGRQRGLPAGVRRRKRLRAPNRLCSGAAQPTRSSSERPQERVVPAKLAPVAAALWLWERAVRPLREFGFGRRSVWEGGAGVFVVAGVSLVIALVAWARGSSALSSRRPYQAIVQLPEACGVTVGTPLRIRGVNIGNVLSVRPKLERVDVLVEVFDSATLIPRDASVEANQSGLIAEPLLDVTPRSTPKPSHSPLDSGCEDEGLIVCDRGRICGTRGVSMDDLVRVCTRLANEVDSTGMEQMLGTASSVDSLLRDVKPLVDQAQSIAHELRPILSSFREGELANSTDHLASSAAAAVDDARRLQSAVLTDENAELLRQSVTTLTKTLQHVERISGDVSNVTGDPATRSDLRSLVQSLSRLVDT